MNDHNAGAGDPVEQRDVAAHDESVRDATARDATARDATARAGTTRDATTRSHGATGSSTLVRSALPRDARVLATLMAGVYAEGNWFVGDGGPRPDQLTRRLRSLDPHEETFLVAERSGAVIGWAEARRYAPLRMQHVATLTLAVAGPARRSGAGRALLRAVVQWARRMGVTKLRLDVRAGNLAARQLYAAEGFTVEGTERAQIRDGDRFEDNMIMARFL